MSFIYYGDFFFRNFLGDILDDYFFYFVFIVIDYGV